MQVPKQGMKALTAHPYSSVRSLPGASIALLFTTLLLEISILSAHADSHFLFIPVGRDLLLCWVGHSWPDGCPRKDLVWGGFIGMVSIFGARDLHSVLKQLSALLHRRKWELAAVPTCPQIGSRGYLGALVCRENPWVAHVHCVLGVCSSRDVTGGFAQFSPCPLNSFTSTP